VVRLLLYKMATSSKLASKRRLYLEVPEEELTRRRAEWKPLLPIVTGGYQQMYVQHVMQASDGADLDFLEAVNDFS
jgi:dihydroxyacid dehydratase/phosphogluconate dehydratase